jgi:hypothetical protein
MCCGHDTTPYEKKFEGFIRLCAEAEAAGVKEVVVTYPWVLADDYQEIVESLSRLADAGLALRVEARAQSPGKN